MSSLIGSSDYEEPWSQEKQAIKTSSKSCLFDKECSSSQEKGKKQVRLEKYSSRNLKKKMNQNRSHTNNFCPKNINIIKVNDNDDTQSLSTPLPQSFSCIQDFKQEIKKRQFGSCGLKFSQQCKFSHNNKPNNEDIQENTKNQIFNLEKNVFSQITHFILFGIISFNFEFSKDDQSDDEELQGDENIAFRVIQVEKKDSRFFMQMANGFYQEINKNSEWVKYDLLTRTLEQSNNQIFYDLAQMIKQLRIFYDSYNNHLELIRIFHAQSENKLRSIQNLRIEYIKNIAKKLKEELQYTQEDFIVTLYFSPDFALKVQGLHSMEINLAFIYLFGFSEDEFASMVMRYGLACWYEENSSYQFNCAIVRGILSQQNIYEEIINDQRLCTFDDYSLKCTTKFTMIKDLCENTHQYLPMPLKPNLDFIVIMKFEVSVHDMKSLIDLRTKQTNREIVQERTNTITYQIHSEVFIDKFYDSDPNKIKYSPSNYILESLMKEEIDPKYDKQCGYRDI